MAHLVGFIARRPADTRAGIPAGVRRPRSVRSVLGALALSVLALFAAPGATLADDDEAMRPAPTAADAYNNRGITKGRGGQYESALTDFDQALRLAPDFAEVYVNRGMAKTALGRYEAALADYDEAIRLAPDFADYFNRG